MTLGDGGMQTTTRRHRARRRSWISATAALLVTMAALASGCGATPTATASDTAIAPTAPAHGGKIVYGLAAETNGWNLATNQFSGPGLEVAQTIFDPLAAFADDLSVHPYLAERIDHDADYRDWTITLRTGIYFHNGRALTAADVKADQDYLMTSPLFGTAYAEVSSISVEDDRTFTFHLAKRWVTFPSVLTTQVGMVAEPDWLRSNDSLHPIGTGPFVFDSWQLGSKLTVKKNQAYWQRDAKGDRYPYLDSIEFAVITDGLARSDALRQGSVDVIDGLGTDELRRFQADGPSSGFQVTTDDRGESGENFIQLNTAVAPFDDVRARRALAFATDTRKFVDTLSDGIYEPATGPFDKHSRYAGDTGYPSYDPSQARQLVDQVKAAHEGQFAFTVYGTPDSGPMLQYLQQLWTAVGIDVTIELMDQAKMIIQVVVGRYQATAWAGFGSPDPVIDAVFWQPENVKPIPQISVNVARWADPEVGEALRDARTTTDPDRVKADYQAVARRMGDAVPYVWLEHTPVSIASSSKLVDLTHVLLPDGTHALSLAGGTHSLHQVWLRP